MRTLIWTLDRVIDIAFSLLIIGLVTSTLVLGIYAFVVTWRTYICR